MNSEGEPLKDECGRERMCPGDLRGVHEVQTVIKEREEEEEDDTGRLWGQQQGRLGEKEMSPGTVKRKRGRYAKRIRQSGEDKSVHHMQAVEQRPGMRISVPCKPTQGALKLMSRGRPLERG